MFINPKNSGVPCIFFVYLHLHTTLYYDAQRTYVTPKLTNTNAVSYHQFPHYVIMKYQQTETPSYASGVGWACSGNEKAICGHSKLNEPLTMPPMKGQ